MSDVTAVPLRPVGKSGIVALWVSLAVLLAGGSYAAYATSEPAVMSAISPEQFMVQNARKAGVQTTASGVEYQVIEAGNGAKPTTADLALIEYRGTLLNGTQFDASKPGQPVAIPVGQVVPGFAEALTLMSKGAKYRVWIPPQLGYGEQGGGPIPPNSVLVFEITLRDFQAMPQGMPGMAGAQQPGM
jgi:FKBP-type peptidyl-prolyl cis-trans isomerase